MNKKRLKALESLVSKLEDLRDELETIKDEESEYVDNCPENLQSSERYERATENVDKGHQ